MNKKLLTFALALAAATAALAQPGPGASAPRPGRIGGPSAGPGDTPGWSMMTPAERRAHHEKLAAMHSPDECHAYMEEHRAQMAERAHARGLPAPNAPRRDACRGLAPPRKP